MGLQELYHHYAVEIADPKTKDWLFVNNPLAITIISFSYLYFVLRCGPRYMKDREPYSLKTFIKVYNFLQVLTNAKLIYNVLINGWTLTHWATCHMYLYDTHPGAPVWAEMVWYFLLLKIIDYTETALFVLRKKQNQITFLHLYHHISTVYITWMATKYYPGGSPMFLFIVNAGVHVIMYSYYFLSACGPTAQSLVAPIKRYITVIQMVQFVVLMLYTVRTYLPGCRQWLFLANVLTVDLVINFALFYNFYRTAYSKRKTR